ncbi:MAG: hypothetical protein ACWGSD_03930, partial [Thermodesulfobacteriota bacterium]
MRTRSQLPIWLVLAALVTVTTPGSGGGQALTGPPAKPEYKYSTEMPPGVAVPDKDPLHQAIDGET